MTLTATVAYPYVDLERATLALCGELRRQAATKGLLNDWSTLAVVGPQEAPGAHGRTWYEWHATVHA